MSRQNGALGIGSMHVHQRIREAIEKPILSGQWPPGRRVPSEHELMAEYGCSRMTVNKVLSALAAQGLILRRRKTGSVVAAPPAERAIMDIQDFAQEAARLGKPYRFEIVSRRVRPLPAAEARRLGLAVGQDMLAVAALHSLDGVPSAFEERLINLDAVPDARRETFAEAPPGSWLLRRVPWTEAEHAIRAVNADAALARRLGIDAGKACLVLERRTWQAGRFVTEARIAYPGERQHFVGRFAPGEVAAPQAEA